MRILAQILLVPLCSLISVASAHSQALYVIGVPPSPSEEHASAITRTVIDLAIKGSTGDRVVVIDAMSQTPIADIALPKSRTDRGRLRQVSPAIARLPAHFRATANDATPQNLQVHLPRFFDTVEALQDPGFTETRMLLAGSMSFGDGSDARFDFSAGTYPSDGYILAARSESVFGTADAPDLSNARLDVLNLDPIEDDRDLHYIQRFWTLYAKERDVVLTSWTNHAKTAGDNALRDLVGPVVDVEIDRRDLRRSILRVDDEGSTPNTWTLVVCIDASRSMEHAYEELRREITRLADELYRAGADIRLSVIPYRREQLEALPLTPVRAASSDGGRSLQLVKGYLDRIELEPVFVDPGTAVRGAMASLDADDAPKSFTVILVVGDTGPEVDVEATRHGALFRDLADWREEGNGDRWVLGAYVGQPGASGEGYFRALSAVSGQEVLTGFEDVADFVIKRAARVTRDGE